MERTRIAPLALAVFACTPLAAQEPESPRTAVVRVYVIDQITRQPVVGALVEFPGLDRRGPTNHAGMVAVLGVPAGRHEFRVRMLGYQDHGGSWMIHPERADFTIALGARPVVLEGVTAQGFRFGERLERRRVRSGYSSRVLDRARLAMAGGTARRAVLDFGQLVIVGGGSGGGGIPSVPGPSSGPAQLRPGRTLGMASIGDFAFVRGMPMRPSIFIDDQPALGGFLDLEMYRADEMYAIEIWRGGAQIRAYTVQWVETQGHRNQRPMPLFPGRLGN